MTQCTTASVDIQFTKISGFELMQLLKILALSKWLKFLRLQYLAKFGVESGCTYKITNYIVGAWNVLKRPETSWNVLKRLETSWNVLKRLETYWSVLKRISPIFWLLDSPISDFQDIPKEFPKWDRSCWQLEPGNLFQWKRHPGLWPAAQCVQHPTELHIGRFVHCSWKIYP
jgi:hypothetical protein